MTPIRRPHPAPLSNPPPAGDVSAPINMAIAPDGSIVLPTRQNTKARTNMNTVFGTGILDVFTWQNLSVVNVDPITFRATMTAVISVVMLGTAAGTVALRTIVTDLNSGVNILDDTGPLTNVAVGVTTPFTNCMGREGILAAEFSNINPLDDSWQILCLPVAGTGNATVQINGSAVLTLAG